MLFTLKSDEGLGTSTIQLSKMWLPVQLCRAPYHRIGITSPLPFLGAITNCGKATATIVMSAVPFVRTKQHFSQWTDFHEIW
jgi:hypothetical protein